jgi:hypothetical protein
LGITIEYCAHVTSNQLCLYRPGVDDMMNYSGEESVPARLKRLGCPINAYERFELTSPQLAR